MQSQQHDSNHCHLFFPDLSFKTKGGWGTETGLWPYCHRNRIWRYKEESSWPKGCPKYLFPSLSPPPPTPTPTLDFFILGQKELDFFKLSLHLSSSDKASLFLNNTYSRSAVYFLPESEFPISCKTHWVRESNQQWENTLHRTVSSLTLQFLYSRETCFTQGKPAFRRQAWEQKKYHNFTGYKKHKLNTDNGSMGSLWIYLSSLLISLYSIDNNLLDCLML